MLSFIRPYAPELTAWLKDFGQGASNYDANGHFARIAPVFNAFRYSGDQRPTASASPACREAACPASPRAQLTTRCPGSATQPAADGSTPWRDVNGNLDCDPRIVPPGP